MVRFLVPAVLILVAIVHALPVVGVLGAGRVAQLYGIAALGPDLELLLRHRAVLFGLLAACLAYAAFRPDLHRLALAAGVVSVASFLALSLWVGGYNAALARVVAVDWLMLALLVVGACAHGWQSRG